MASGVTRPGPSCPSCGAALAVPLAATEAELLLTCAQCGGQIRIRRRGGEPAAPPPAAHKIPGRFALGLRVLALAGLSWIYRAGLALGTCALLVCGGFVPLIRRWLADEPVGGWRGVEQMLGGVPVLRDSSDPDADYGPALTRVDAPELFQDIAAVARQLVVKVPDQIRLTYLPACGVTAWGRTRALMIGLPLLSILTRAELRAVLAHELAHLARGDATRVAQLIHFFESLEAGCTQGNPRGPLGWWAGFCSRAGESLLAALGHGQELQADRAAASVAGGPTAGSALVKVAIVQGLFREVLEHYAPTDPDQPNLYALFRQFWAALPKPLETQLRQAVLSGAPAAASKAHPSLLDRLHVVQEYPDLDRDRASLEPAISLLADPETLEQMLHNRLYGLTDIAATVFHRAGS